MSVGLTDKAWLDLLNAEKARAEKAEAELRDRNTYWSGCVSELQKALAAARRECEESRKALRLAAKYLRDGAPVRTALEWIEDALAATAAGEEGK